MSANTSEAPIATNPFSPSPHSPDQPSDSQLQSMTPSTSNQKKEENSTDTESKVHHTDVQSQRNLATIASALSGVDEDAAGNSMTGRRFTIFSKLPIELRLIIWEMALPGPRCITGWFYRSHDYHQETEEHGSTIRWILIFSDKSPVMLYTCQESRAVALGHYQLQETKKSDLSLGL